MNANDIRSAPGSADWDFPTLAWVWDWESGPIVSGADRIEALPAEARPDSLIALRNQVRALAAALEDGWLVLAAFFMVEDLYKSFFHRFRWSAGVHDYIEATAGALVGELDRRGLVMHYVVDSVHDAAVIEQRLTYLPAVFDAAGLFVTGPQLMALEAMQKIDHLPRDVSAIQSYRDEGQYMADQLITQCHRDSRSSAYLNLDLDDDAPAIMLDAALSQRDSARTIVIFRDQPPAAGSVAQFYPPPDVRLPELGGAS